jgi:transcriptional regulator with XRE-family HTH domain
MAASDTESLDFARAFGDALSQFLQANRITQAEAARRLGLAPGKGKARINTYCHDSTKGKRAKPDAEILYRVCAELGFAFEYRGFKISAAMLNGNGTKPREKPIEQFQIEFDGQFNLTETDGIVSINVKRPPGRIEVALSLKGASQGLGGRK